MRPSKRKDNEMRDISFEVGVSKHAEGSCLVKFGDTHVLIFYKYLETQILKRWCSFFSLDIAGSQRKGLAGEKYLRGNHASKNQEQ